MARNPERELQLVERDIDRLRNTVKITRSNLKGDDFVQRTADWHRKEIEAAYQRITSLEAGLADLLSTQADGPQIIHDALDRIDQLETRRDALQREVAQVKQLRALGRAVGRLQDQAREDERRNLKKRS